MGSPPAAVKGVSPVVKRPPEVQNTPRSEPFWTSYQPGQSVRRKGEMIIAIDQGTTGSTVCIMDARGHVLARGSREFPQHFPKPGWVEHNPDEIWTSVLEALASALADLGETSTPVSAIGLTNQRETMMVWERESGDLLGNALVWQDRRTASRCENLAPRTEEVRQTTGLVIDPYFSASKLSYRLDEGLRDDARAGHLAFGTVDSFLIEKLTGGTQKDGGPKIEVTNASRTLLMDLRTRQWSREMCDMWDIPEAILPSIVPSAGVVGRTRGVPGIPDGIPISGIAGDQHAALFGQGCIRPGDAKCTYGTGAFVLVNTGAKPLRSEAGLLSTLAWQIGETPVYALEGASFIAGAAVQWLRDGLGLIREAAEIEGLARQVDSSEGVAFVPALAGLGAPYWDPEARGVICGITRGTTAAHMARATLDAIAFQVDDLLRAMQRDLVRERGTELSRLRVDGGAARNDLLMQLQADLSQLMVDRPTDIESTARGAGMLAAVGAGLVKDAEEAAAQFHLDRSFEPQGTSEESDLNRRRWEQAVARSRSHLVPADASTS